MNLKGNPNLKGGGKKGRSGRKSVAVEFNKARTIEKAWAKVDKEVEENLNVAAQIVLKDMASKVSNADGSNLELKQVLVKFISNENDRDTNTGGI